MNDPLQVVIMGLTTNFVAGMLCFFAGMWYEREQNLEDEEDDKDNTK